ncbi:MAG: hypothetical protein KH828_12490 [Clostridiales bacterium]|nr:hypothetical protein [Clostridiales bacterium]
MNFQKRQKIAHIFLVMSMFCSHMLCGLLSMGAMMATKKTLPKWEVSLFQFLGWTGGTVCFILFIYWRQLFGEPDWIEKRRELWGAVKKYLWLLAVLSLSQTAFQLWLEVFKRGVLGIGAFVGGLAAGILAALFLTGFILYGISTGMSRKERMKHPLPVFLLMPMELGIGIALSLLSGVVHWIFSLGNGTVITVAAEYTAMACCTYGAVKLLFFVADRGRRYKNMEMLQNLKPQKVVGNMLSIGTALLLIFAVNIGINGSPFEQDVDDAVKEQLKASIAEGSRYLNTGNQELAGEAYEKTAARYRAFESLTQQDVKKKLEDVYLEKGKDGVIGILYFTMNGNAAEIEQGIRRGELGAEWYPVLLDYYKEVKTLTPEQEELRDDLLTECMVQKMVSASYLSADDIIKEKKAVSKVLEQYEEWIPMMEIYHLVLDCGANGGVTESMAEKALEYAENNRENAVFQYMAAMIGSSYQIDGAEHYKRTAEAAQRFDEIYDDGKKDKDALYREKMEMGAVCMVCEETETALEYVMEAYELTGNPEAALNCARMQDKLEKSEECMKMAKAAIEEEPYQAEALYLCAISALRMENTDDALEYAGKLADMTAEAENLDEATELSLYSIVQYLAMNDIDSQTDFQLDVYDELTEEQQQKVQAHKLLWDYMTAMDGCFESGDLEAAEQAIARVLEVREDLIYGWYLRGTIAWNDERFEDALSCFKKAEYLGGQAPAIYFSMANLYDALNDMENAYRYANRANQMLPTQEHGRDIYGISYYSNEMIDLLKMQLEGE